MKEKPIIFNGEMVRAILDGRKIETRRVVKPQSNSQPQSPEYPGSLWVADGGRFAKDCPYGAPGTKLWVRESLKIVSFGAGCVQIRYKADDKTRIVYDSKLLNRLGGVSSIHMPRNCCRITLDVTAVRCELLKEITVESALAEGIAHSTMNDPRVEFQYLWDSINNTPGHRWVDNPFVWVVQFKRCES